MSRKQSQGTQKVPFRDPREPTPTELAAIDALLRRLREHFHEWPEYADHEHNLVAFAFYEGFGGSEHCGALLTEAAPLALGKELVARQGFRWVMIPKGDHWRYGAMHPALNAPIDLLALEHGSWCYEEYHNPPSPGRITNDSLDPIVAYVRQFSHAAGITPAGTESEQRTPGSPPPRRKAPRRSR